MAACGPAAETPEQMQARMQAEAESVTVALDAIYARMASFITSESADSMATLYADDARMFPEAEPLVEGREAIRAKYAEWFGMGSATVEWKRLALTANGPLAVERGTSTMTLRPEPGVADTTSMTLQGKFVIVWRKVGDQWLMSDDIGNSNAPMVPPPAEPKK
jgi:ketosteroid isomerase-like protein